MHSLCPNLRVLEQSRSLRKVRIDPIRAVAATGVKAGARDLVGPRCLVGIEQHRSAVMEDIVELTVIEIEALSRLHDFGVRFDLFDADDSLIFDDRTRGGEPSTSRPVAKKFVMTNEEKVLLFLGKELFYDDVVPLKVRSRYLCQAVVDSVVEGRSEAGTVGIISNKGTKLPPRRWIPFQNPVWIASEVEIGFDDHFPRIRITGPQEIRAH